MRKQVWKKGLTGILCTALFFTNVLSAGGQVLAAETDIAIADNKLEVEKTESGTEGTGNEETVDAVEGEQEEKDSIGENTEDDGEEQEDADFENANDEENDDTENEVEDLETEAEEADLVGGERKDNAEDLVSREDMEDQTELVADSGDIASGSYVDITWVIDANGKLTVEGTGEILLDAPYVAQPWYDEKSYIKSAEINVTGSTNAAYLFAFCSNLEYVDLRNFETDNITSMQHMFDHCENLTNIEGLDNTNNVTDMSGMFWNCEKLTSLDLSNFDTSKVTSMRMMFYDCYNLDSIDLSNFNTSNVTNMGWMFSDCRGLSSLDLSSFKTNSVTDMA